MSHILSVLYSYDISLSLSLSLSLSTAGTMSGGGNKVAKGRMSSKLRPEVSPQQLQQLEQTLQDQEKSAEVGKQVHYIFMILALSI